MMPITSIVFLAAEMDLGYSMEQREKIKNEISQFTDIEQGIKVMILYQETEHSISAMEI